MDGWHSQMRCKDEIARELLAEGINSGGKTRGQFEGVDRARRDTTPNFLSGDRDTEIDILTGAADSE